MSITHIAKTYLNSNSATEEKPVIENFRVGDTINVKFKILEGGKQSRTTYIEGICIKHKKGVNPSVTIRKISSGIGIEKTIPLASPLFTSLTVVQQGSVRRAFLSYLRKVKGAIKIKLKLFKKQK